MSALKVHKLTKKYKKKTALKRLSFSLENGIYGLLGPNGAGKTTLIKIVAGILTKIQGRVTWNGHNISEMGEEYRKLIGFAPQTPALYPEFKAKEFLLYIAALKGVDKNKEKLIRQVDNLLKELNLLDDAERKIREFSGGMKQRLNIAQALLGNPKLLLLDEPTAGLDPKERIRLKNLISSLSKDCIVIWSTHIVSDVESIAKEILLLKKGQLIEKDTAEELRKKMIGKVGEIIIKKDLLEEFQNSYLVSSIHISGEEVIIRIISDDLPLSTVTVSPTLEDMYLYHFNALSED